MRWASSTAMSGVGDHRAERRLQIASATSEISAIRAGPDAAKLARHGAVVRRRMSLTARRATPGYMTVPK